MRTSAVTRDVLQVTLVSSFVLLVSLLTKSVSSGQQGVCPRGTFGRNCQLACQCKDDADCDDVKGNCPDGCLETWSGPNCQRQNVVLGMPTDMKTPDWSKGARAVDGDLSTCVTSSSNRTGWWRVDMRAPRTVFYMEIFFANQTTSPGRIRVHVSKYADTFWGKPCARIPASHKRSKFACDLPTSGQYFGIMNKMGQITLCEVKVYVCTNYTFGADCSLPCRCANSTEVCHKVTGTCMSGCMVGWTGTSCQKPCKGRYGPRCRYECGHCYGNQTCNHVTGLCQNGCASGWTGPMCKQACPEGRWGLNCSQSCQHCLDSALCSPMDGRCPWRCRPGWHGPRCDVKCKPGFYGQSCEFSCGHCYKGSVCDSTDGVCPIGCEPGFEGLFCIKVCLDGSWGPNCRYSCGHCTGNVSCDVTTGHCLNCLPGWMGQGCDTGCQAGKYGQDCASKCRHCREGCHVVSGVCVKGCLPGWSGPKCNDKCGNSTYGDGCAYKCGHCEHDLPCHHETGRCPHQCALGYKGPVCNIRTIAIEDRLARPDLATLLVVCMIAVGCTLCAAVICLLVRVRRRNRNSTSSQLGSNGGHELMVPKAYDGRESPLRQTVV